MNGEVLPLPRSTHFYKHFNGIIFDLFHVFLNEPQMFFSLIYVINIMHERKKLNKERKDDYVVMVEGVKIRVYSHHREG